MKFKSFFAALILAASHAFAQYPGAIDSATPAGATLRCPHPGEAPGTNTVAPTGTANPTLTTYLGNLSTSVIGIENVLGLPSSPASGTLLYNPQITKSATLGPIYIVGASYEDELNLYSIAGGTAPFPVSEYSDGNSWVHDVCTYLGKPCVGRYAVAGQSPNPLGTNYAVGGASTYFGGPGNAYSIPDQIAQLITDHGPTLPSGTIVIVGAFWPNDIEGALTNGGVWAPPTGPQSWAVSSSGGFTAPTSGNTVTVTVVSSTGMVASQNISFLISGTYYGPFPISSIPDGTHVTIGASVYGAISVPNSATIQTTGAAYCLNNATVGGFATAMANIVAALPSNGLLVIVNSPDVSLMPFFSSYSVGLTICHNTWLWYGKNIMAQYIGTTTPKIATWDMSQSLVDVVTTYPPTNGMGDKYGFKNVAAGLGGTYTTPVPAGYNANDWAFWDGTTGITTTGVHPTGAMHKKYARDFLEWLKKRPAPILLRHRLEHTLLKPRTRPRLFSSPTLPSRQRPGTRRQP